MVAAVLLRQWRDWCGHVELATDDYGRIHFPFCDWVLVFVNENSTGRNLFSHRTINLNVDEHEARWSLPDRTFPPLVCMPRRLFDAMFIDNRAVFSRLMWILVQAHHGHGSNGHRSWATRESVSSPLRAIRRPCTPS